jgi:hypothetical protein
MKNRSFDPHAFDQEQGIFSNQKVFAAPQSSKQAFPRSPGRTNLVSPALSGALDLTSLLFIFATCMPRVCQSHGDITN